MQVEPVIIGINNNTVNIYPIKLSPNSEEELNSLYQILSSDERERANKFISAKHRAKFIIAHGKLRQILSSYLATPADKIEFSYNEYGKPDIKNSQIKFSLSHSHELAAIAITVNNQIGIDIEAIKPLHNYLEIAKRFFSKIEFENLMMIPESARLQAFFHCWARKEAFIKAIGLGLSYQLNKFSVSVDPNETSCIVESHDDKYANSEWFVETIAIDPNYACAVATDE